MPTVTNLHRDSLSPRRFPVSTTIPCLLDDSLSPQLDDSLSPRRPLHLHQRPVLTAPPPSWQRLYAKDQHGLRRNPTGGYRGRLGCDETKYAEALILGPRHA